jgi:MFS family permease
LEPGRAALWLGVIAAAFALPMLVLPPLGGAVADRLPRLKLLWLVQISYLAFSTALATLTLTELVDVWFLIAYAFANGVILAFDSPVRHALLPDLVTREQLTSAVSLNSAAFTGAALVGPAIAGMLIPVVGVGGVFIINAVSCVATLWALSRIRGVPQHGHGEKGASAGVLRSIGQGVAYVRRSALLSGLLTVAVVAGVFARSYTPLLAVFARDEFRVGSEAFGFLVAAGGLGTLAGAFGLAGRGDVERRGRWVMAATLLQATLLFAFATSPWYALALPLLVLIGVTNAISGALTATLIQLAVPNQLRGRVMSLYMLTLIGVPSAGSLLLGATADVVGVRLAVGGGALVVLLLTSLIFVRNRELREAP